MARFHETLRRLAMIDESFVEGEVGLRLDLAEKSALDPRTAALLQVGASALTVAELRLLPLLSTHLSFPEIAAELFLSRSTVKTQVLSIYRKLGASSRNRAVSRARELGLLEG